MRSPRLLISGAIERPDGFALGEGKYYHHAILLELNTQTGEYRKVFEKSDGGDHYPEEHPNLQFTAACIDGDTLWLPTDTEIYKIRLPGYEVENVISHPCFQNVHSVHVIDGDLIATSTGLDNIVFMDPATGAVRKIINAEGLDPWHRFDKDTDYRLVHSTRPHDCHPNYVFKHADELWTTRCKQEDAVCLANTDLKMDITRQDTISVHDGVAYKDQIVFTRVDGYLVFFDTISGHYVSTLDPFANESNRPVGWCRGLCIVDDIFYLGYSKIRKTKLKDKLRFLAKGNFKYSTGNNAMVVAYDLVKRRIVTAYETQPGMIDAIYGVNHYPDKLLD